MQPKPLTAESKKSLIKMRDNPCLREKNPIKLLSHVATASKMQGKEYLEKKGYEDVQMWCAAILKNIDIEGTNINTLAQRAGMSKQATSKIVKDLHRQSYVTLATDANDRRSIIVRHTNEGVVMLKHIAQYSFNLSEKFKTILGEKKYDSLIDMLQTLDKALGTAHP